MDTTKFIEQVEKMTASELNELVKALEEKFGVSAAAFAAAAPAAEPAAPASAAVPAIADLPPAVVAAKLAELFPALFGAGRALPIKLRIQADIQAAAPGVFTRQGLSAFLRRLTGSSHWPSVA